MPSLHPPVIRDNPLSVAFFATPFGAMLLEAGHQAMLRDRITDNRPARLGHRLRRRT